MKQIVKLSVALAVAAAVAVPLALAGSGGGRTLEFVSVEKQFAGVPAISRSAPPQVGTRLIFRDLNYNRVPQFGKPAGALIGRAEGVCTLIAAGPQAQCLITAHVPDGQVVVGGEGDPGAKVTHYAVLGGIGAYAGARGTVTATALSETKSLIVVHLSS